MPRLSAWLIRAALVYLAVGFTFGAGMLVNEGLGLGLPTLGAGDYGSYGFRIRDHRILYGAGRFHRLLKTLHAVRSSAGGFAGQLVIPLFHSMHFFALICDFANKGKIDRCHLFALLVSL